MLEPQSDLLALIVPLKFFATWLSAWCGVPGGIFAPSLAIGNDIATPTGSDANAALIKAAGKAAAASGKPQG